MKRSMLSLSLFIFIFLLAPPCALPFEKLKYIGEISIEKNIKPVDFALNDSGDFYIADNKSGKVIIYNKFGNLVSRKSIGKKKLFYQGGAMSLDRQGNLIIVDSGSNKIFKMSPDFEEIFVIGGTGHSESQFKKPFGISTDDDNNFYIADSGNRRIQVFNLDGIFFGQIRSGERETSQSQYKKKTTGEYAGSPELALPYLSRPTKVALDEKRNIYVLDSMTKKVHAYDSEGDPLYTIDMKKLLRVKEFYPIDMAVGNDKIFVLSRENIKIFSTENGTYISNIGSQGKGRGQFYKPVAVDTIDNMIYILDAGNRRVQIMEYGKKKSRRRQVQRTLEKKTKIAIFDFKSSTALSKQKQFGETVSEMFITSCVNTQNFLVVERKEIKRVLDELQFDLSDMVDINTAKKVGKILGVDYGIVGSVAVFDNSIEIDVRFIQLETGVIVLAESKQAHNEVNLRNAVNEIVSKIERIYVNRVGAPQPPNGFYTLGGIKSIYLRWDKSPEDDVSSYKIYRSLTKDGEFNHLISIKTNEFNDTQLKEGAEYYYRLSVVDSRGNESKLSEIIICKTREKPTFGYVLKINTRIHVKKSKFSWKKPEGEKVKEYRIFRSDSESGEYKYTGSTLKTSFEDTGLEDGKTYYYRIKKAFPDGQESQFSNSFSCRTDARPQPPVAPMAQNNLARRIALKWEKSKVDKDISKFQIYRSEFPDNEFTLIKTVRSTKHTDIKLLNNKTYYYKIQTLDKYGLLSDFSEVIGATTKDIPAIPRDVNAQEDLPRKIILSWDKNPEKDITHYVVFRSGSHDGEYKKIGISKTNEYTDPKLNDFTEYFYFITAVDKDKLESKPSETFNARTKPLPTTPANIKAIGNQANKIPLIWDKNPEDDIKHYIIYSSPKASSRFRKIGETVENSFVYKKLKNNATFYFQITAVDKDTLVSKESQVTSATTKPLPPSVINVKAEIKESRVIVSWVAVEYDDLFGYVVYKNGKKVEIIKDNIYIDEKFKPGQNLKYEITSMDNDKLESPKSQSVKIKVPKK